MRPEVDMYVLHAARWRMSHQQQGSGVNDEFLLLHALRTAWRLGVRLSVLPSRRINIHHQDRPLQFMFHQRFLSSGARVADGEQADYFFM